MDLAVVLWGAYCAWLLFASRTLLRRTWTRGDPAVSVAVASLAFALLSPRMMVYSYLLLVVPVLLVVREVLRSGRARAAVVALIVIQGVYQYVRGMTPLRIPTAPYPVEVALMNLSFFVVLGIWLVLVRSGRVWAGDGGGSLRTPAPGR
jgi:hypothetical protein